MTQRWSSLKSLVVDPEENINGTYSQRLLRASQWRASALIVKVLNTKKIWHSNPVFSTGTIPWFSTGNYTVENTGVHTVENHVDFYCKATEVCGKQARLMPNTKPPLKKEKNEPLPPCKKTEYPLPLAPKI